MSKETIGKHKDGVSVQEIENFGKKYRLELFFCIIFILASFFTFIFFGPGWSIYLASLGGILGVCFPAKSGKAIFAAFHFTLKQEKLTRFVLAGVGIVLSIFLPPLVFLTMGVAAGRSFTRHAKDPVGSHTEE